MAPRNPMVLLRDALILRITHLFHPFNKLTVELFLNRDVRHRRHCRGAMPMLLAGGDPDHVAWPDLFDGSGFALNQAAAGGDDQRLPERMSMPCSARARL